MNKKRFYANNSLSENGFLLIVVVSSFLFSIIYCKYLSTLSIRSFWDYTGYIVCLLILGGLGYFFSLFGQRNILSVITVVLIPALFYDSVRMWKYSNLLFWIVLSSVPIGGIVAFFFAKNRTRDIQRKGLKRKATIGLTAKAMRLICCLFLLASVIIGKVWIRNQMTLYMNEILYNVSDSVDDIPDYENSLTCNIGTVSKIDPAGGWHNLTLQEKTDVLSAIIRVETRYFGLVQAPTLKISYLPEHTLGEYDHSTNELTLSYQYLIDTDASGYSITNVLLHEMRHAYQKAQIDLLRELQNNPELESYSKLLLFYDTAQYADEMENYVSGEDNYALYSLQELEIDAERYANSAMVEYYEKIQSYLNG